MNEHKWLRCQSCKHIHSSLWQKARLSGKKMNCEAECCLAKLTPVDTQRCPECFGEGQYMDRYDDDRPAEMVTCYACRGLGVVVVKSPISAT